MKKILILLAVVLMVSNVVFAEEVKDEMYYKQQIQNQKMPYSKSGFFTAVKSGNNYLVENYINAGFDVNTTIMGVPITIYAISNKNPKVLEQLLKAKADPNVEYCGYTLLGYALSEPKNVEMVSIIINNGADVNRIFQKETPLNYAIKRKQTQNIEALLKAGAKPDDMTDKLVEKSKDTYLKKLVADFEKKN